MSEEPTPAVADVSAPSDITVPAPFSVAWSSSTADPPPQLPQPDSSSAEQARDGDPEDGDPKAGDPGAGDPGAGDPEAGDPEAGDPEAGGSAGGDSPVGGTADTAGGGTADGDTADDGTADGDTADDEAAVNSPWNDPRLPWEGKPRRVDVLCWATITLVGLYYLCLLPFRASLVGTHPLVLVLLNGATEGIVSAAASDRVNHSSLVWIVLASVIGLMKFDFIYWWAGRLWGERVILLFSGQRKHGARFINRVQRWGKRFTWPAVVLIQFVPIPNAIVYAVAGWAGMRLATFLILDAIGSLAWAGMLIGLGYALGRPAVAVAHEISRYGLWVTIAILVLVVVSQIRGMRSQR